MIAIEQLNTELLTLIATLLGVIIWGGQKFMEWQKNQSANFIARFQKNDEEHTKILLQVKELSTIQAFHERKLTQHDKEILSIIDHIKKSEP